VVGTAMNGSDGRVMALPRPTTSICKARKAC
jgi:hypothetical protein